MTTPTTRAIVSRAIVSRAIVSRAIASRAIVSLAAVAALALGACVPASSPPAADGPAPVAATPRTIRFENGGREHVDVYLIGEEREWLLGRVAPGARTMLRLPHASVAEYRGFVQLAVIPGERRTLQAARDPRARISIEQPMATVLSQRWTFDERHLLSMRLPRLGGSR